MNSCHRDTPQVLAQEWPVFSRVSWAQDSVPRTKVADFRCRIEVGGVMVENGDLIFGNVDGVLVLRRELGEEVIRKEIENGTSSTAAFAKYGTL